MGPSLPLTRVMALIGGFALIAAYFMPWFASQGLLLSGQFLNDFLASASTADLQRFMPGTGRAEAQLLRLLVDLFPACGAIAVVLCVLISVTRQTLAIFGLVFSGVVPLIAWAAGVSRLPPGSTPQVGLWLIAVGALAVLLGAIFEFASVRNKAALRGVKPT